MGQRDARGAGSKREAYLRDDTVEARALITETVLASGELAEVAGGLGDDIVIELEDDAARGLSADGNIELGASGQKRARKIGWRKGCRAKG